MPKIKKTSLMPLRLMGLFWCLGISSPTIIETSQFISPTKKQISQIPFEKILESLQLRKVPLFDKEIFGKIILEEQEGFLGYHGDSLDFYIFQDIIRLIIEGLLKMPVRSDFHFLAPPLDPLLSIQSKNELTYVFSSSKNPGICLYESTFPMNFCLWDNFNRLGLNSIEQFLKNESVKPLGYQKRLRWLFKTIGIPENEIQTLFELAHQKLNSSQGVILQIIDTSKSYAFSSEIAYPSYPNGFIAENRTVDEYYMNEIIELPYPHEVRLLLTNHQVLNPHCPLRIIRYTPDLPAEALSAYENALKSAVLKLPFNQSKGQLYLNALKKTWSTLENEKVPL